MGAAEPQRRDLAEELASTRGWTADASSWAVSFWVTVLGLDGTGRATILPLGDSDGATSQPDPTPAAPPAGFDGATILPPPPVMAPPAPAAPPPPPVAAPALASSSGALAGPPSATGCRAAAPARRVTRPASAPASCRHPSPCPRTPVPAPARSQPNPTSGTAKPKTVAKMAAYLGRPVDAGFVGYEKEPTPIVAAIVVMLVSALVVLVGIMIVSVGVIVAGGIPMTLSAGALPMARKRIPVRWVAVSGDRVALMSTVRDSSNTPVATSVVFDGPLDAVQPVAGSTSAVMVGPERVTFLRSRRQSVAALVGTVS